MVFPDGSDSKKKKKSACSAGDLGWEDRLEGGLQPTPVLLPGEFYEQWSLVGCIPWGRKELDATEQLTLSLFPYIKCIFI